ncbi:MAG: cupredoxin domain-containing protein [Dehalococcoidia bacterium]
MKTRISALARPALSIGLAVLVIAAVACGSDDSDDNASGTSGSAASNTAAVDASGAITIIAKDNVYDPKSFTGPGAQSIKVTLDNQGAAIHDFVIKDQKGPDGKEIQTGLIQAGKMGTVEFTLAAGDYDFYCAVHPVEMRGEFTLS